MTTWSEYLDAVEASALRAREQVLAGGLPVVEPVSPPEAAHSVADEPRRRQVLALVEDVAELIQQHQNAVRDRLRVVPLRAPRASGYASGQSGEHVNLLG